MAAVAFLLIVGAIVSGGVFMLGRGRGTGDLIGALKAIAPDPDKAAIRKWLNDNLDDADFEEVKWFGPVSSEDIKKRRIAALEKQIAEWNGMLQQDPEKYRDAQIYLESDTATLARAKADEPFAAYRLRYRQKLGSGSRLTDSAFIVRQGRVQELLMCSEAEPIGSVLLDPRLWFIEEQLREADPQAIPDSTDVRNELRRICDR